MLWDKLELTWSKSKLDFVGIAAVPLYSRHPPFPTYHPLHVSWPVALWNLEWILCMFHGFNMNSVHVGSEHIGWKPLESRLIPVAKTRHRLGCEWVLTWRGRYSGAISVAYHRAVPITSAYPLESITIDSIQVIHYQREFIPCYTSDIC